MSLQNPNDCFGMYRSSDSYIQGTADYNRWLNCELNKEFISAENGLWNQSNDTGRTKDGIVFNEFGGGVTRTNTVDNIIKTVIETASNTTSETAINAVSDTGQKVIETTSKNPLLTIGIVFAVALLLFKK